VSIEQTHRERGGEQTHRERGGEQTHRERGGEQTQIEGHPRRPVAGAVSHSRALHTIHPLWVRPSEH